MHNIFSRALKTIQVGLYFHLFSFELRISTPKRCPNWVNRVLRDSFGLLVLHFTGAGFRGNVGGESHILFCLRLSSSLPLSINLLHLAALLRRLMGWHKAERQLLHLTPSSMLRHWRQPLRTFSSLWKSGCWGEQDKDRELCDSKGSRCLKCWAAHQIGTYLPASLECPQHPPSVSAGASL